jgi:signal transduction histidine kinase
MFIQQLGIVSEQIGCFHLYRNHSYTSRGQNANSPTSQQDNLLITITANGSAILEAVKAKIFQPFFTTKPTGQGTGLALSFSYDFVKAHGGELKMETKEGEETTFIIKLPTS